MTKTETLQILAVLKAAYPSSYKSMTKEEARGTVAVWYTQLSTVPADLVLLALQKCIAECKFPPSVCEVRQQLSAMQSEAYFMLRALGAELMSEKEKKKLERICDCAVAPEMTLDMLSIAPLSQDLLTDGSETEWGE